MRKGVEIACAKRAVRSSEKWWGNILHYYYPKFNPLLYYPNNLYITYQLKKKQLVELPPSNNNNNNNNNNICFYICVFKNLNELTIYIYSYLQDRSNIFEGKHLK